MNRTDQVKIDKQAYKLAKTFLLNLKTEGITSEVLSDYLDPSTLKGKPDSIAGIYHRILESARNSNMKRGVIGDLEELSTTLEHFDPKGILDKYAGDSKAIQKAIAKKRVFRTEAQSIWPKFCKTIISAATFMDQFATADDFYSWVDDFDQDDKARASLPMLLSSEIYGFGFALSCDFLKELGYVGFPKPDVHLRHIFDGLKLCPDEATDYQLFKSIIRVAGNAGVSPYCADKIFWLIGSGRFYGHKDTIGKQGRIGSKRTEFIKQATAALYPKG